MAFAVPTFSETLSLLVADYQNRFPNANVSRRSDNWRRLANQALAITGLHRHIDSVAKDAMPDTTTGDALHSWLAMYGLTLTPATVAFKAAALRITGVATSAYTDGDALSASDGTLYELNASGTIPAAGYVNVDVIATTTGSVGKKSANTQLSFISTPSGLDTVAILQIDIDEGGADLESEDHARVRLRDKIAEPGMGGNANDFRQWAKEVAGIDEAYVYPLRNGLGSVHLAALHAGQGSVRTLSGAEVTELQDYIDALRPVGYHDFTVLTTTAQATNLELVVEPETDSAFEFDWDDEVPLAVLTWTAGTRTLQFSAARPVSMVVGHRIVIKAAALNDGHEYVVEGLTSTDKVVLKDDAELATAIPAAADVVYSGGPLVAPVREALLDHINNLGPGRVDTLDTSKDYSAGSSYWEGSIRTGKIRTVAQQVAGVLDTDLLDPLANVNPTNAAPASTVSYISPRQIIVRRKW